MSMDVVAYLSIPIVAGLVGWITNWLAIQLTFYPLEFKGIRPFLGWQGIIPSKAKRMATMCVDSTLSRIGSVSDVVEQMDPEVIVEHILQILEPRVPELVDEVMLGRHDTLWRNLPNPVKRSVYRRVEQQLPHIMTDLLEDISPKIETLFDLKQLVIDTLEKDTELLNRIFLDCGKQEFAFIIKSGLWFGFLFGLPQMLLWYFLPYTPILPICGFLVGWATNWVALNLIFRPLEPHYVFGFKVQGLFLKRQDEVSESFCRIVTEEILTVDKVVQAMVTGTESSRTQAIIQKHFENLVDEAAGIVKPFTQLALGAEGFAELKTDAGLKALQLSHDTLSDPVFNQQRAQKVQSLMAERMKQLPSDEFQELLRPCFKEDEIKLILIGGVLGALAGLAQASYIFGFVS
jgi:uncharacterized membrane protein YheB (UPF0754 family)